MRRILDHLLKWQVQPGLRGPSWRNTLVEQRRQAEKLLRDSPSLRPQLPALCDEAWPDAVRDAINETGLRPYLPRHVPVHVRADPRPGLHARG